MTRAEVFEKMTEIFRDLFDDESLVITDQTTSADIEAWDSLEHVNLITAVEDEFGIRIPMTKAVELKNVGEMADVILERI